MNDQKKLKLSKETLRCLDDDALTDVVGGGGHGGRGTAGSHLRQLPTTPRAAPTSLACISDQGQCNISGDVLSCIVV